ncbi:Phage protein [Enhygromyxa salina]|uniref:Phage protein n=1 Tax=Enhygromyxa salina TaxID=215803 RepID=A0A0C1ZFW9_9BACT|nr:hypothetical protein [Enhygromyxa salina]KIG16544.1 Phage protein [Enhygromyxa salina]
MSDQLMGSGAASGDGDDRHYTEFLASVRTRFEAATKATKATKATNENGKPPPLFTTATTELFDVFLDALPASYQQQNTCASCRSFFERYGGLVTVDDAGKVASALWGATQSLGVYDAAVRALAEHTTRAPITGVFVTSEPVWGKPTTGDWKHLAVTPASELVFPTGRLRRASEIAAERREDYRLLRAGLEEFPLKLVKKAAALLSTGGLYRSEKCISVANWLLGLHQRRQAVGSAAARDNVVWLAVATAPPGFCHVRSSMIGTLLEDLAEQLPFDVVKAKFDAKMHPLQYQRPTAAPGKQNIERAEKIVAELRSAGALERRFATLADLQPLWVPSSAPRSNEKQGVFSHLKAKLKPTEMELDVPAQVMTWEKFSKRVVPNAARIEYRVPSATCAYLGLVTAKNPEAPPIIQWDSPDKRNPVTWYVYVNGSPPARWNLKPNTHHEVSAITLSPAMWGGDGKHRHHGNLVIFVLEGAKDLKYESGAGFFPEFLKSDYREIRKTLEAYTKAAVVHGKGGEQASGIALQEGASWGHVFRVTDKGGVAQTYKLDRWD